MAANQKPIFPKSAVIGVADLSGATALTSRAKIVGTTGLTQLTPVSAEGKRVDEIRVKGCNTVAGVSARVFIWLYDGTNSYLFDELTLTGVTPDTVTDSAIASKTYSNLVLPATYKLYASVTVASGGNTNCTVFALGGDY
jgi:hypothetical protein